MKINSIELDNFKSFSNFKADKFKCINMIFGYNNSGKSNLLQAIYLIFKKKAGGGIVEVENDDGSISKVDRYKDNVTNFWDGDIIKSPSIFYKNDKNKTITFKVEIEEIRRNNENFKAALHEYLLVEEYLQENEDLPEVLTVAGKITHKEYDNSTIELVNATLNGKVVFNFEGVHQYFPDSKNKDILGNEEIFLDILAYFNNCVLFLDSNRYFQDEKQNYSMNKLTPSNFKNWLFNLSMDQNKFNEYLKFIEFLKKFKINNLGKPKLENNILSYPFNEDGIGFAFTNDNIELMVKKFTERYPIFTYGTGIQQILYILAKIFDNDSKILVIEELELNLSPRYQEAFLEFLSILITEKKINQLIFSSHSYYFGRIGNHLDYGFHDVFIDNNGCSQVRYISSKQGRTTYLSQY